MSLHARQVALAAGAFGPEVDAIRAAYGRGRPDQVGVFGGMARRLICKLYPPCADRRLRPIALL
jgi:hypothetical protein